MGFANRLFRRFCWPALVLAALLLPVRGWAADGTELPRITDAVRDGTGRVWGIASNPPSGLYVLDENERWRVATPPGSDEKARPCCLGRRADGVVVCVWRVDEKRYQWSTHHGQESRLGPAFAMNERRYGQDLRMTADGKNNLWLTQEGPDIYRLAADGKAECAHTISAEECLVGTYGSDESGSIWNTVSVFEDAGGRVWFWTDHADGGGNGATIRGALVYDDGKFVQHDFLMPGGQAQASLTALAQKDAQHLWFARIFDGLYTLDTTTFQAERVPGQPNEARMTSLAMHCGCGVPYFIMDQTRPEGGCSLWRLTDGNHWEKLIDPVDSHYDFQHQQDRLWSQSDHGEYLGTNGNGMWVLPGDGSAPVHVDWRQRFPLATPHRFIDLQNGRWLGISTTGVTWIGAPGALVAERAVADNPRLRTLRVEYRLHPDGRGHLWSMFAFNSPVLHEWDGEHWIEHRLPDALGAKSFLQVLHPDTRGRVWLRSSSQKKKVVIYDPQADDWKDFDSFEQALGAQDGHSGAEFSVPGERFDLPCFGPQGLICYLTEQWKVMVFADHAWRQWSRTEITGQPQHFIFDGPPFTGRDGQVCINADHQTWAFLGSSGWKPTAYEQGFADDAVTAARRPGKLPPEIKLPFKPDVSILDDQGSWWLTWQRGVYKSREGLCVPVLAAAEAQPFNDGRRLDEVFIDARGNAFLRSGTEYVILAPPGPLPQTTLAQETDAGGGPAAAPGDRMVVRLGTDAGAVDGKFHFRWRLDDGPWTPLTADGPAASVTLDALPGGPHRFEARSLDAALQTDAAPVVLPFEIHVDPGAQITGYIARLADPDFSQRAAAVAALARQPDRALSALRAARAGADESQRWWIDAAEQQIESAKRSQK